MEIHIAAGATTYLEYPDDFRAFKVVAASLGTTELAQRLTELGRATDDLQHVYVDLDLVRSLAGDRANESSWQADLLAMLAFAERSGWVDSGRVRAHVDFEEE